MRIFDKLLKRNGKEREQHQKNGMSSDELEIASTEAIRGEVKVPYPIPLNIKKPSFKERYPNGLPLNILKNLDYSKFGAILKSKQLLPPSYDRNPAGIDIKPSESGDHNVKLIFKSKTSASYRIISIRKYDVSMTINNSALYNFMPIMSREWENFCERIMWLYEKGFTLCYVNQIKLKDMELDL